ncbi:MAG: LysM peptidoglycan-binding domain-containing protein [Opitutaceae bacterium]|nr:LysM peptidoglycan-binding domain-containing protein [Opitutaceae bacterium]
MLRRFPAFWFLLFAGGLWLLGLGGLAGCAEGNRRLAVASEMDEPDFRRGQALVKAGRNQEALVAFQRVMARRGEDAPESHLEVGLLYLQHIKDPILAIYHFNQYVRLRPNSPQTPLVKQRIDTARREFARTLPAQPLDSQFERLDLLAAIDRLKQENEMLKGQIVAMKGGLGGDLAVMSPDSVSEAPVGEDSAPAAEADAEEPAAVTFQVGGLTGAVPTVHARSTVPGRPAARAPVLSAPPRREPPSVAASGSGALSRREASPGQPAPAVATGPAPSATRGGRIHVIGPGDTLMNLALRYYGSRSKWRDVLAANRDQLASADSPLKIGMKLKIP